MNDEAVRKQLDIMVSFIKKEADEKASEIRVKADEEFTLEKARLFQTQKQKIIQEFERKMKQVVVQKKITHSNELAKARLELLKRRETGVQTIFDKAKIRLDDISHTPEYKALVVELIIQAVHKLHNESVVEVVCREEDLQLVKEAAPLAKEKWEKLKKSPLEITTSTEQFLPPSPKNAGKALQNCSGGVIVTAQKGRIVCNNTLDVRLQTAYEQAVPEIRKKLFGNIKNL